MKSAPAAEKTGHPRRIRYAGVDLIKVCAMYFVLSLHFFLYGGFYNFPIDAESVMVLGFFRMLSYECVPLFLIISGFLMGGAKPEAKHYIKITPIVMNAVLVSAIIIVFRMFFLHEKLPLATWLETAYHLQLPSYAWYVNMFIPLYLMMPFINAAYQKMDTAKAKFWTLGTLIFVANLAITVNRFKILDHPDGKAPIGFTPNYFGQLWPFAYYWVGLMIAEYRPHIKKWLCALVLALLLGGAVLLDRFTSPLGWNEGINFTNEDFPNILIASVFFLLLYDIRIKKRIIRKILAFIASLSMTVYLMSFIGDCVYLQHFLKAENSPWIFIAQYFKIIPLHFIASVAVSIPVYYLGKLLSKLIMNPLFRLANRKKKSAPPKKKRSRANAK